MSDLIKIAAVQMQPEFMQPADNLAKVIEGIRQAAAAGARLIVLPECALSGFVFTSRQEAWPYAQTIPGDGTDAIAQQCQELEVHVVCGLLEREGETLYNSCVLVGPGGIIGHYRKCHLLWLGIDRFVTAGNLALPVFETALGNIGMNICYDIVFPESARVLALQGADILVLPANFPRGRGEKVLDYVVSARALENRVNIVAVNRVGREKGMFFAGLSKIAGVTGETLAQASLDRAEIIYGEVDFEAARQKHLTIIPGQYELDYFQDRRPELYGRIVQPSDDGPTR